MPGSLDTARRKVVRAFEHAKEIQMRVADYASGNPYEIIPQPKGREKIKLLRPPPSEIALITGELIYQLRSALDHLFFELVERNQRPRNFPPPDWQRPPQSPLSSVPPPGYQPPIPRDVFVSAARDWISDRAFTFIERLQPYYRGKEPNRLLGILLKLSNIDKHRRFNTIVLRVNAIEEAVVEGGTISYIRTG